MSPQYPLKMNFKVISFGPQIYVRDAAGRDVLFVHQKAFKLKEDVAVYADSSKNRELYRIKADRIIDFSARYHFTDSTNGMDIGSVKREGMKSMFKSSYNIYDGETITHHLKEDNPWIKFLDALVSSIEIIGMFTGYFLNPTYTVYRSGAETPVLHLKKLPSFLEGAFSIERVGEPSSEMEETRLLLSLMMITLLERSRG
jgi:hypothetical protein